MNVRLDEARQQIRSTTVNYFCAASGGAADRLDPAAANHHIAFDHVEGVVHGEDRRAADD
jgi:hypothetical protein